MDFDAYYSHDKGNDETDPEGGESEEVAECEARLRSLLRRYSGLDVSLGFPRFPRVSVFTSNPGCWRHAS